MKPFSHTLHPLFQQLNVGSEVWWNTVNKLGSPLVNLQKIKRSVPLYGVVLSLKKVSLSILIFTHKALLSIKSGIVLAI